MGALRAGAASPARALLGLGPRRNARLLGPGPSSSFYDPKLPAWFELTVDPRTGRLLALRMTAQAHFMRHRYCGFDRPFRDRPAAA